MRIVHGIEASWCLFFALGCAGAEESRRDASASEDASSLDSGVDVSDGGTPPDGGVVAQDAGVVRGCLEWSGTRVLGTALDDEASDVSITEDGEVVVVGFEAGRTDITNVVPTGESRGVLYRLSVDGDVTTESILDGVGPDTLDRFAGIGQGGTPWLVGRTPVQSPGSPDGVLRFDIVLGELGGSGLSKPVRFGGVADDRPTATALTTAGVWYVAGYEELFVVGGGVERYEDGFVARIEGETVTRRVEQTTEADFIFALAADDEVVVVGGVVANGAARGPFVRRLDSELRPKWSTTFPPGSSDAVTWLHLTASKDVLAVGALSRPVGGQQVVLLRIDAETGQAQQIAEQGGADAEWPMDAVVGPRGGLVVVGETLGGIQEPTRGQADAFVMWLSPTGALDAVHEFGSTGGDRATAVAVDQCGNVAVVGVVSGGVDGVSGKGRSDAFVKVIASPL